MSILLQVKRATGGGGGDTTLYISYVCSSVSVLCDEVTSSTKASLTTMLGISLVGISPSPWSRSGKSVVVILFIVAD